MCLLGSIRLLKTRAESLLRAGRSLSVSLRLMAKASFLSLLIYDCVTAFCFVLSQVLTSTGLLTSCWGLDFPHFYTLDSAAGVTALSTGGLWLRGSQVAEIRSFSSQWVHRYRSFNRILDSVQYFTFSPQIKLHFLVNLSYILRSRDRRSVQSLNFSKSSNMIT